MTGLQKMNTTLLIMAAGIGSRFGGGIKQLEPVGMHDEIIMDYSIHDAIAAGFNKIVFVIRKDIEADFRKRIGDRVEKICGDKGVEIAYAFQDINDVPGVVPEGRTKPWGTGQAVLCAKEVVNSPFMVINADDYYGKEAFVKMHKWLCEDHKDNAYAMAGFILKNTLSENGGVTRGICKVQEGHGHIVKSFFEKDVVENPLKAEYLLPNIIGGMLREGACTVRVLETKDKWFGVTYKEDKAAVVESFKELIRDGVYGEELYGDL